MEFVDIAGIVKGASEGAGLGNKFLANIRATDAIVHVVRCFVNDDIIHVDGNVDPLRDIDVINLELILADLVQVEKRLERVRLEFIHKLFLSLCGRQRKIRKLRQTKSRDWKRSMQLSWQENQLVVSNYYQKKELH